MIRTSILILVITLVVSILTSSDSGPVVGQVLLQPSAPGGRVVIFAIGKEDKSYAEFLETGWRGQKDYACRAGVDCIADRFPGNLHIPGMNENYGVERVTIYFVLAQPYHKIVLRLARGGDETTVVRLDSGKTFHVTSAMLGSGEGWRVGAYELNLGALRSGGHRIELSVLQDGKGNGGYSWDALTLFGIGES